MTNNRFRHRLIHTPREISQVIVFQKTTVFACGHLITVINVQENQQQFDPRC
jgi:hypothetical protein